MNLERLNVELFRKDVVIEGVNRQDAQHDKDYRCLMTGKVEKILEEGIQLSTGYMPFAGACSAIISVKRNGNNKLLYSNPVAYEKYAKGNGVLSTEEQTFVKEQGRFLI